LERLERATSPIGAGPRSPSCWSRAEPASRTPLRLLSYLPEHGISSRSANGWAFVEAVEGESNASCVSSLTELGIGETCRRDGDYGTHRLQRFVLQRRVGPSSLAPTPTSSRWFCCRTQCQPGLSLAAASARISGKGLIRRLHDLGAGPLADLDWLVSTPGGFGALRQ